MEEPDNWLLVWAGGLGAVLLLILVLGVFPWGRNMIRRRDDPMSFNIISAVLGAVVAALALAGIT
jgi:hypothetical protein